MIHKQQTLISVDILAVVRTQRHGRGLRHQGKKAARASTLGTWCTIQARAIAHQHVAINQRRFAAVAQMGFLGFRQFWA